MLASSSTRSVRTVSPIAALLMHRIGLRELHAVVTRARELDREGGAAVHFAVHLNVAAVALDDGMHDGQAEAGPLPWAFGGEERIEDVFEVFLRDVDAGVRELQLD